MSYNKSVKDTLGPSISQGKAYCKE